MQLCQLFVICTLATSGEAIGTNDSIAITKDIVVVIATSVATTAHSADIAYSTAQMNVYTINKGTE